MGKFDMTSVYSPEYKLSLNELTFELWEESGHTREESYSNSDFDKLRHRLSSKSKDSGLIQRLQKINLDLQPILDGPNGREKFDALMLIKLFYKAIYIKYPKVNIIKLMERPRFGNFTVGYTLNSANSDCFQYIYNCIRAEIGCAEEYEHETTRLDSEWCQLANGITRLFFCPEIIWAGQDTLPIMEALLLRLKELSNEGKLDGDNPSSPDNIIKHVFLYLIQHKYLAQIAEESERNDGSFVFHSENDADFSKAYLSKFYELSNPNSAVNMYRKRLKRRKNNAMSDLTNIFTWDEIESMIDPASGFTWGQIESMPDLASIVTWDQIELINNIFSGYGHNPVFSSYDDLSCLRDEPEKVKAILYIAYFFAAILKPEDMIGEQKQECAASFRYVEIVASWLAQRYRVNFEEGIPLHVLLGIVQTVYFIKVNNVKYENNYYGNRTKKRSLMAAIQDGEEADATAKLEVEIRVIKRMLSVLSSKEFVSIYGELQTIILTIKKQVFTQNTLESMKEVHQNLYTKSERIIKSALDEIKSLNGLNDLDVESTVTLSPLV